jgi:hypothetical protein
MRKSFFLTVLIGMFFSCANPQIEVAADGLLPQIIRSPIPKNLKENDFKMLLMKAGNPTVIPYQIEGNQIFWKLQPSETSSVVISLRKGASKVKSEMIMKKENGHLSILYRGKKLMDYQYDTMDVPEGVDPSYRRSGYIHPLNTPSEQRLTRIQPKDHYHHYGLWNPWTHTLVEGDTIDFWNLNKKEGTVRFAKFLGEKTGAIFSEYKVLQEHVVIKEGSNKVVLNEVQNIRIIPLDDSRYLLDFVIDYECATNEPFKIIKYRYGGFGWRTTEFWNNQNSRVLTSKGMTHKNADGTTARWCIVDGELPNGKGGAVIMSHPDNFNHPEPLRIWPEDQYGRGDLFANMAPTKTKNLLFKPGEKYTFRYRMLVYDGEMSAEIADWAWQEFANPKTYKIKN